MDFYKENKLLRLIILFLFTILCIGNLFGESPFEGYEEKGDFIYYNGQLVTSISLQRNSDIIRLRHLEYYGKLIEEYHEKAGIYPFQTKSKIPTYIYVANSRQKRFTEEYEAALPFQHNNVSFKEFVVELERVLEREIEEYYDPQFAPDVKWNWYLYAIYEDVFYFAIHVHQRFPFSKFRGPYSFKVEISNVANRSSNLIIISQELFDSALFRNEVNKKVEKEDYFIEREEMFLYETKTLK